MNTLTLTAQQATILATLFFLAGVGAACICYTIIAVQLTARAAEPEPEVIVVEAPPRRRAPALPARQRFATPPAAVSPAQWARQAFDDPRGVRLAVQIGAGASA